MLSILCIPSNAQLVVLLSFRFHQESALQFRLVCRMECVFLCESSDYGVCLEPRTDSSHECGMYMWFVDLHIGTFDLCSHLPSVYRVYRRVVEHPPHLKTDKASTEYGIYRIIRICSISILIYQIKEYTWLSMELRPLHLLIQQKLPNSQKRNGIKKEMFCGYRIDCTVPTHTSIHKWAIQKIRLTKKSQTQSPI